MAQHQHQPLAVLHCQTLAWMIRIPSARQANTDGLSPVQKTLILSIGSRAGHSQEVLVRIKWFQLSCQGSQPKIWLSTPWLWF